MSNYTILQQNTLVCFRECDESAAMYLEYSAKNEKRAFLMALKWRDYRETFKTFLGFAGDTGSVYEFLKTRFINMHFPNSGKKVAGV